MVYAYMLYDEHKGNDCQQINIILSNRLHHSICYITVIKCR